MRRDSSSSVHARGLIGDIVESRFKILQRVATNKDGAQIDMKPETQEYINHFSLDLNPNKRRVIPNTKNNKHINLGNSSPDKNPYSIFKDLTSQ